MTIEERAKAAVDGMRIRNDEIGRGPSHDEVEALLRKTLSEMVIELSELGQIVIANDQQRIEKAVEDKLKDLAERGEI